MVSVDFRDVTEQTPAVVHFPEHVRQFETLGFVVLGRMARVISPGGLTGRRGGTRSGTAQRASQKPRSLRPCWPRRTGPPTRSWTGVGACPRSGWRTVLADGAVVESRRAWDRAPVWRKDTARGARHLVLSEEQRLSAAPGRDVDVVSRGPGELWRAHRARVVAHRQRHGGEPVAHATMDGGAALSRRLADHDLATERRRAALVLAALVAYVLVAWSVALAALAVSTTAGLLAVTVAVLVAQQCPRRRRGGSATGERRGPGSR